jgi:hypothetical protein
MNPLLKNSQNEVDEDVKQTQLSSTVFQFFTSKIFHVLTTTTIVCVTIRCSLSTSSTSPMTT